MRIAYTNLVTAATAPTASTAEALFPITNVQNQRLASKWRSTTSTVANVVVDLGSAQAIDVVAVFGHNASVAGTTISIQANATDSWGSPSINTSLTIIAGAPILRYFTSAMTYRYWRFLTTETVATFIESGAYWLGTFTTIDPSSRVGYSVAKRRSDTVAYSRDHQKYATEGVGWREFRLQFPRTSGTALTNILSMFDAAGLHGSMIFSNFDDDRSYTIIEPCYCSVVDELTFRHTRSQKYEYSLTLEENR